MAKLKITDLQKIKERVHRENALREGVTGECVSPSIWVPAALLPAPREVMNTLMNEIAESGVSDVAVTTSGCMGLCSREPEITVEILGADPIVY